MTTYSFVPSAIAFTSRTKNVISDKNVSFCHSGNMGDVIHSCYFVKEYIAAKKLSDAIFHVRTNVPNPYWPSGRPMMSMDALAFLKPFLELIFDNVTHSDGVPDNCFDLDRFRKLPINFSGGDIRAWYYNLCPEHLPQNFDAPLVVPPANNLFKDRIILICTERYQNISFNWKILYPYRERLIFFGWRSEYEKFCSECFPVEFYKLQDAAEAASLMSGAGGVIGNSSGLFAIAESLKVPRVFLSPEFIRVENGNVIPGPVVLHPRGGWFEMVQTQEKFRYAVENLMNL